MKVTAILEHPSIKKNGLALNLLKLKKRRQIG
jgi:hypothetical protein